MAGFAGKNINALSRPIFLQTASVGNVHTAVIVEYSGLTLNQYGVASPCRTICTVCGFVALS